MYFVVTTAAPPRECPAQCGERRDERWHRSIFDASEVDGRCREDRSLEGMCAPSEPQALQGWGGSVLQFGNPGFLIEFSAIGKLCRQVAVGYRVIVVGVAARLADGSASFVVLSGCLTCALWDSADGKRGRVAPILPAQPDRIAMGRADRVLRRPHIANPDWRLLCSVQAQAAGKNCMSTPMIEIVRPQAALMTAEKRPSSKKPQASHRFRRR